MTTNIAESKPSRIFLPLLLAALLAMHIGYALMAAGGWAGLTGPWPLVGDDHPIAEHNAWVTRHFFLQSGTNAGYDPYFMAGYPKSLLSSPSSTLFEVVGLLTGGKSPILVHKFVTFLGLASLPFLLWAAGATWKTGRGSIVAGVALLDLYIWTDGGGAGFPSNFARYGMVAYMVAIPLGLIVIGAFSRYLALPNFKTWLAATLLASLCFMTHVTSVMILGPSAVVVLVAFFMRGGKTKGKVSVCVALMALGVVVLNAFWWFPLVYVRSMSSEGNPFFTNPDVLNRMASLLGWRSSKELSEPTIQAVILGFSCYGLMVLSKKNPMAAIGLASFGGSGFFWGYLAGYWSGFNFLQPGRQTYALYVAGTLLAGAGIADLVDRVKAAKSRRLMIGLVLAILLIGSRVFVPDLIKWVEIRWRYPFLGSSTAPPHLDSIVKWIRTHVKPGERLFYEEVGEALIDQKSPYAAGRYSGMLPEMTGVEMIGGFYLYVGLKTNFTQIGEKDKQPALFGGPWTRERFLRYSRLYRPSAIICWSEEAMQFCRVNPDLIDMTILDGRIVAGRVKGFEGATIRGRAEVSAEAGQLRVTNLSPDLDGLVVLRYHFVPGLRAHPPVPLEPVRMEDDPVPFIGVRPSNGQTSTQLDLAFPPGR